MAKITSTSIAIAFTLSLLLFSIYVESRSPNGGFGKAEKSLNLECNIVVGVKSGDTCFDIARELKLDTAEFSFINPNLNCSDLFVGQWLCISGSLV